MRTTTILLGCIAGAVGCSLQALSAGAVPAHQAAAPVDAAGVLARFKAETGGVRWDSVTSLEVHGTLAAGGLSGPMTTLQDVRTGRSVTHYTLGPVTGSEGFDGTTGWSQDPGGEVTALDAPEARETARTDAWLSALGYWYPARAPAAIGPVRARDENGMHYLLVDATPPSARTVTLWFDANTGLLVRTVERRGGDIVTSALDDYRDVGGVRLAYHIVTDRTDPAGRTDERNRTEVLLDRIVVNASADDGAFAMPAMAPSARIADASGRTRVPFELVNNHIYASASIDGKPVRFLVDTGGANLLTPAAAKRLGIASEGRLAARGVGDEQVDLALAHASEVKLGSAVLAHPVFYVVDLGPLPDAEGTDADGLVGFEMFRRFRVSIDYAAHMLVLTDPAKFQPPAGAHVVPFEMADRIPIVAGTLDGLPVRLSIDTGSRGSLTMNSPFVREHGLVARYAAAPETVTGWGVGGPSRGRPARLGALTLGDVTIRDIVGDLYTGDKGAFANSDLSGNLGGGVLRRFTVTFDYDAKRMYLAPNAAFHEPDPFDRSGMWLLRDGNALKVVAVTPDAPAARAGLAEGDDIVRIGGEAVAKRTLAEWRVRLRELPAGTRLTMIRRRGGIVHSVVVVLADAIPEHARVELHPTP